MSKKLNESQTVHNNFEFVLNPYQTAENFKRRQEKIFQAIQLAKTLSNYEARELMTSHNEVIREIGAKTFVEKTSELLMKNLMMMLTDKNCFMRESAVVSLCYINTPQVLPLLEKATQDFSVPVKMKALVGIADIAFEFSDENAKNMLQKFQSDECQEVRRFIDDELSIIG